ncbi:MAG: 6-carboxytetrahydropterin synthase [Bryobacteraceae bacterium]|nr:6-carboxytetrahydropterin synthase [Bryobacteraceae bacterium]
MRITRVYRFSSSHRLHAPSLTEGENQELYGKCNNPWGHGHDYTLHITVEGEPDSETGRIVGPGVLDRYVEKKIISVFDHRDINTDVPGFQGVPTTENLAVHIVGRLQEEWQPTLGSTKLFRVYVQETPRNTFEVRPE